MKRILVWHLPRFKDGDSSQGPRYYADADYLPGAVRLHARQAPADGDLKVDIRDDGTSIFTSNYAALNKDGTLEENAEDYPAAQPFINEGSAITLHVMEMANSEDITCELELYSVDDEEDESDE